ncbi:MAG TPA: aromatic acid exporter family protein [Amnibacterium sp.]
MTDAFDRRRWRIGARRLLHLVWPSSPASWREVPSLLRPQAVQIVRLTVAAVVAYVAAELVTPGTLDLTAPLTALLVVQASTVGTLQMGIVRVGAVLTGVLVAVGVSTWIGLTWWSLALAVAASLTLAKLLRLGEQSLETPISAMLILAVSAHHQAAQVRLVNTLIGTAVGIVFSLVVPVAIPNRTAAEAVRRVARSQAALLDEIASTLGERPPEPEELEAWAAWAEHIGTEVVEASLAIRAIEEARRLNPRALGSARLDPTLRSALARLDRCLAAERALLVVLGGQEARPTGAPGPTAGDVRRAFAVLLDDIAGALRAYGDAAGAADRRPADREAALSRTLETVRETRAVLTELRLLDVDPRGRPDLWMLQGSVLAAVEHVLAQLDAARDEAA